MQLAQLNIAQLRQPMDHPDTREFAEALGPINALADAAPGFVWRLQTQDGDATALRPLPDPQTIINLSVWDSPTALADFVFRSSHTPFLRRRSEWFSPQQRPHAVAWWVDHGHLPTVEEALGRLAFFTQHGASPYAFGVSKPAGRLAIRRVSLDSDQQQSVHARTLIEELNRELSAMYPEPGSTFFTLDPDQVKGCNGVFLVAELEDVAIACGAFRVLGDEAGSAEIKRMFVRPAARGLKVGAAVLSELEQYARTFGVQRMVLETGVRQASALTVYTRAGYEPCSCWGGYVHAPLSRCFHKELSAKERSQ